MQDTELANAAATLAAALMNVRKADFAKQEDSIQERALIHAYGWALDYLKRVHTPPTGQSRLARSGPTV